MGNERTRKMRGKKTFGYGSKKKHRGGGSRGGRGMAGSFGHKKMMVMMKDPGHFGKKGFKSKAPKKMKSINLRELEKLAGKLGKNMLNLEELGYSKVLGTGKITAPLEIEALQFSAKAKEKIEKAGGKANPAGKTKVKEPVQ